MIKFRGDGKDGPFYLLGVTQENIDRLVAGQPIKVNLAELGGPEGTIAIMFGSTGEAIFKELKLMGVIDEQMPYREAVPGMTEVVRLKKVR